MIRRSRIAPGIALAAVLLCGTAKAQDVRIEAFEKGLRPAVHVIGSAPVRWTLQERMAHWKVPGLSIAVIRNGKVVWAKGYGVKNAATKAVVDTDTLFSVGSLSKVGTAIVTLRLAGEGQVDLDRDVDAYMKRWHLPASPFLLAHPVTLRGLMAHTAGMTVDGFADFRPGETLPTIVETLDGRPPSKEAAVEPFYVPGTRASYSGGGTTVEQLVIEDVTGLSFAEAARRYLLEPLGMTHSSYVNPLPSSFSDVAMGHDGNGIARSYGLEAMPENAASGLWTTPSDYARLMIGMLRSYRGEADSILPLASARDMMVEVGASHAGLGPFLAGQGASRRFYHGGANDSFRAWMEMNLVTGNGVVLFTNSPNGTRLRPEVVRAVALAEGWSTADTLDVPAMALSVDDLARLAGDYEVMTDEGVVSRRLQTEVSPITFHIASDGHELSLSTGADRNPMRLIPADAMHFIPEKTGALSVEFVRGYDNRIERLLYRDGDYVVEARRLR